MSLVRFRLWAFLLLIFSHFFEVAFFIAKNTVFLLKAGCYTKVTTASEANAGGCMREQQRKLFCEISPFTYKLARCKCILQRMIKDILSKDCFAKEKSNEVLPVLIYGHKSLIRRKLGNVDLVLQENKATNLSIAAPKVSGILMKPGETFSFWQLVGAPSERKGYQTGLVIEKGKPSKGTGGGMCQFTNLIHWMILHSPLDIVEYHHHDNLDLFPDFGRQVPFGTGTSVFYNYGDYRFKNNTEKTFQIIVYTTEEYLCGELRATQALPESYHIDVEDEFFSREDGVVYRNNKIYRFIHDKSTGNLISKTMIKENHAKVMYETEGLDVREG